jgi:hypothetical protein
MASTDSFDPSLFPGTSADFDPLKVNTFADPAVYAGNLALEEDPLFPVDWDQEESPPYEGNLYSTPLNWDPPEPKVEPLPTNTPYTAMNTLTLAQQEKLRNIAMPTHLQYRSQHSPNSNTSTKSRSVSLSENRENNQHNERSRKRKSSADADEDEDDDESNPPVKKTAHNMIEKRYRTNLNDKIAALRDSVPSLRMVTKSQRGEDTADDREDLQGLTPAHKLNKSTVLSKATEYINFLEKKNKKLEIENKEQKARLSAFETLFRSGSMGLNPTPMQTYQPFTPEDSTPVPSPASDIRGMIPVPDDMRRWQGRSYSHEPSQRANLYPAQMGQQQAFALPQEQYQPRQQMNPPMWNPTYSKMMLGSLAGLMLVAVEGMYLEEQPEDSPNARGLSAIPVQLVRRTRDALNSNFSVMNYHILGHQLFRYMEIFLLVGIALSLVLPRLFSSTSKPEGAKIKSLSITSAPALAAPIHVRQQAWLTAIQTVWVPQHNFLLEVFALCLKIFRLTMRNVVGMQAWAYFNQFTEQEEVARVKAWEIAIDAQLAGGDTDVSARRLVLTLFASYTLPTTPARLMLRALHLRVLFWELGNKTSVIFSFFRVLVAQHAHEEWDKAQLLYRVETLSKENMSPLTPSLAALVEQDFDEVFIDAIGQRAYNLAWNFPTTKDVKSECEGMDEVVKDIAIQTPLDAVAAWYSCLILQRALTKSLEMAEDDVDQKKAVALDIALAVKMAPVGSHPQLRALIAQAVLVKDIRGRSIAVSMQTLRIDKASKKSATSSLMANSFDDLKVALKYAIALAHLERKPSPATAQAISKLEPPSYMSLLTFTAAFKLMQKVSSHNDIAASSCDSLEILAGVLRIWVGGKAGEESGLGKDTKTALVEKCLDISKRMVGMEDAGYESMSDEDTGEGC